MRDRLDRAFLRFRSKGDTAALAEVFDRSAPELLRVALRLVRDPSEADDLLQATYLTAIERADSYQPSGKLVGWLIGILVRHGHELRRGRGRTPDLERVNEPAPAREPHVLLEGTELEREVEAAITRLSATERSVLEPFLREGKRAIEIARELGLAPGTVRTRLHRGLDSLRKALPAGLALEAGAALLATGGLSHVREAVLKVGMARALPATARTTPWVLGGLTMTKKLTLAGLGLVLAVALGAVAWQALAPDAPHAEPTTPASAQLDLATPEPIAASPPPVSEVADVQPEGRVTREERTQVKVASLTGGVSGRLLEADGSPIAGMDVALIQWSLEAFLQSPGQTPPKLVAATSTTSEDGAFTLRGASSHGTYLLGYDLGGPRGGMRALGNTFVLGGEHQLGEIRLGPTRLCGGQILDRERRPVAGATVRATHLPAHVQPFLAGARRGGAILGDRHGLVFHIPDWAGRYVDRLPIPTTVTDDDGRFSFPELAGGANSVLVTHDQFATHTFPMSGGAEAGEADMGTLVVDRRRELTVLVHDAAGNAVSDVELQVGSLGLPGEAIVLERLRAGKVPGEYRYLAEPGQVVWGAARTPNGSWTIASTKESEDVLEIVLAEQARLLIEVVDAEGQPCEATIEVIGGSMAATDGAPGWIDFAGVESEVIEVAQGSYRIDGLEAGDYVVNARSEAGNLTQEVELAPGENIERLQLIARPRMSVRVVDGSGDPIQGASVSLFDRLDTGVYADMQMSDAKGLAELQAGRDVQAPSVRVVHPAFATAHARIANVAGGETLVRLAAGGELLFRGLPEETVLMFKQAEDGLPARELPELFVPDGDGLVRVTGLEAGAYAYDVFAGFPVEDVTLLLGMRDSPLSLQEGKFEIVDGQITELHFAGMRPPSKQGSSLAGVLRLDGVPFEGAHVVLHPRHTNRESIAAMTDRRGHFEFPEVDAGPYFLLLAVLPDANGPDGTGNVGGSMNQSRQIDVEPWSHEFLEIDWQTQRVRVHVSTPDGAASEGARVGLSPFNNDSGAAASALTDAQGWAELQVLAEGPHYLQASHAEQGMIHTEVEVGEAGSAHEFRVVLERGVPLAGRVVLKNAPSQAAYMNVSGERWWVGTKLRFEGNQDSFELVGARPGTCFVHLSLADGTSRSIRFELPADGDTNVELVFDFGVEPPRGIGVAVEAVPAER